MHRYTGYELEIETHVPLPAFQPSAEPARPADLAFCDVGYERIEQRMAEEKAGRAGCLVGFYPDICYYAVLDGRTVEVWRYPGVEDGLLGRCLISLPIAVALRQRGLMALHGCAVALGDEAVAFMGHSGAGKSTLAEAFFQRGHSVLCDDLLALRLEDGVPHVIPGHTEIRLRPQAGAALLDNFDDLPTAHSTTGQRFRDVSALPRRPLPLRKIYFIDGADSPETRFRPATATEAYAALATQTWAFQRFQRPDEVARHQEHLGLLVRGHYVVRAERVRTFDALREFVDLVVEAGATAALAPAP